MKSFHEILGENLAKMPQRERRRILPFINGWSLDEAFETSQRENARLREEMKQATRLVAYLCGEYGDDGRIEIPEEALLREDLTLYREAAPYRSPGSIVFVVRAAAPTGEAE